MSTAAYTDGAIAANSDSAQAVISLQNGLDNYGVQEAFKTLRTNIDFSGEGIKVICVTSALPGEGKSTVSYNLARAFAQNGRPTLLIDADLRRSVMRTQICKAGEVGQGLTYYLVGQREYEETVCRTDLQNLDLILAGKFPPNPSELLGGKRFASLIERARQQYSIVIVDTPPIGSVIDAAIVARICDGSVLVLREGTVSYRLAQQCKSQLEASRAPILGCVLNDVEMSSNRYYSHYYKAYGDRYYGEK